MVKNIHFPIEEELYKQILLVKGSRTWTQFFEQIVKKGLKE